MVDCTPFERPSREKQMRVLAIILICLTMSLHAAAQRVPLIDITDLYHPPQDPGDNFDLIAPYALPEVDLRAVIFDVTAEYRKPTGQVAGLPADDRGPREPGFIPVTQ